MHTGGYLQRESPLLPGQVLKHGDGRRCAKQVRELVLQ